LEKGDEGGFKGETHMPTSPPVGRQVGTKGHENVIAQIDWAIQKQRNWIPRSSRGMTD